MGLTKQYLRYAPNSSFGLIASAKGGVVSLDDKNLVASATAETVTIWNLKTGERITEFKTNNKSDVTALAISPHYDKLAIGFHDGSIKLFSKVGRWIPDEAVTFNGHKSSVACLSFDLEGHRLASGSRDTIIIVWDVVNECGLFRLRGHKGPITNVAFDQDRNVLVSSSKDTLVKFWDLNVQHCFKTLTGHIMEVWDFALIKNYLVTASSDSELRIFKLTYKEESGDSLIASGLEPTMKKLKVVEESDDDEKNVDDEQDGDDFDAGLLKIERIGSLLRQGQDKAAHLVTDLEQRLLAVYGSDNCVELFLICSDDEVKKRLQKRAKKERRKNPPGDIQDNQQLPEPTIQEEFLRLKVFRAGGKVRQMEVSITKEDTASILVSTANNLIETFNIDLGNDVRKAEAEKLRSFDLPGHRSDVRSLTFSSCNTALASVSHEALKIWNRSSRSCIRTIPSGYGLCVLFVPGDRHVLVGTKTGSLQIFDLNKAEMTEEVAEAHSKEIWSMALSADRKGFVTASADQTIKFWTFEPLKGQDEGWSVVHTRTLQLDEDALSVKLSPDGRLIAVSLLDSTIKVFFVDSLKFFLSLYGHKLPVLAIDISSDSTLIITGSADKNVKIWGLDFGDCHKSIFAHDDSVTAVHFVPNTHHFFTAGKDGLIKQWDADNFERILTLKGHLGEV
jgi:U3 small nucleolar RNA-associated protein 12